MIGIEDKMTGAELWTMVLAKLLNTYSILLLWTASAWIISSSKWNINSPKNSNLCFFKAYKIEKFGENLLNSSALNLFSLTTWSFYPVNKIANVSEIQISLNPTVCCYCCWCCTSTAIRGRPIGFNYFGHGIRKIHVLICTFWPSCLEYVIHWTDFFFSNIYLFVSYRMQCKTLTYFRMSPLLGLKPECIYIQLITCNFNHQRSFYNCVYLAHFIQ